MTLLIIYIIGAILVFYYETEDIFLGSLPTSIQGTIVFALCWPFSIIFGAVIMWKEIIKKRGEKK